MSKENLKESGAEFLPHEFYKHPPQGELEYTEGFRLNPYGKIVLEPDKTAFTEAEHQSLMNSKEGRQIRDTIRGGDYGRFQHDVDLVMGFHMWRCIPTNEEMQAGIRGHTITSYALQTFGPKIFIPDRP